MPSTPRSPSLPLPLAITLLALAFTGSGACSVEVEEQASAASSGASSSSTSSTSSSSASSSSGGGGESSYWSERFGDFFPQIGASVAVSPSGDVAVLGMFRGTIDFGLGPLEANSPGLFDIFVLVLDPSGKPLWNRDLEAPALEGAMPYALAFAGEDLVVAGSFGATRPVDLGKGPLTGKGGSDVVVARFDPTGHLIWDRQLGGADDQFTLDVATDTQGHTFVNGRFAGTVDFGTGPISGQPGNDNTFLVKLDPSGNTLATAGFDVQGLSYSYLATDSHGHVFMMGALLGSADFGKGLLTATGGDHLFAAAYDEDLHPIYAKLLGDPASTEGQTPIDLAVDAAGDLVVSAWTHGPVDFGGDPLYAPGGYGQVLLKLDPSGNRLWDKALGPQMTIPGIAVDASSEILLASGFKGTLDLGLGPLSAPGDGQALILAKLDANGALLANRAVSGDLMSVTVRALAATPTGDFVLLGELGGSIDLGYGPLKATGGPDVLIAKLPSP